MPEVEEIKVSALGCGEELDVGEGGVEGEVAGEEEVVEGVEETALGLEEAFEGAEGGDVGGDFEDKFGGETFDSW